MQLKPIVFYTNHVDVSTYRFLIGRLEFFQKCGYKTICIEFGSDMSIQACIEKRRKEINIYSTIAEEYLSLSTEKLFKMHVNEVAAVLASRLKEKPLDFIDSTNVPQVAYDLKRLENYKEHLCFLEKAQDIFEIIPSDLAKRTNSNTFDIKRESELTSNFAKQVEATDGCTIMIVGLGHSHSFKSLLKFEYIGVHLFDSRYDSAFYLKEEDKDQFGIARQKNPVEFSFDFAKIGEKKIFDTFANTITKYNKVYEKQLEDQCTVNYLNHKYQTSFKAYLRFGGTFFVDALMPYSEQQHTTFCKQLNNSKVSVIVKDLKKGDYTAIENINEYEVAAQIWGKI